MKIDIYDKIAYSILVFLILFAWVFPSLGNLDEYRAGSFQDWRDESCYSLGRDVLRAHGMDQDILCASYRPFEDYYSRTRCTCWIPGQLGRGVLEFHRDYRDIYKLPQYMDYHMNESFRYHETALLSRIQPRLIT